MFRSKTLIAGLLSAWLWRGPIALADDLTTTNLRQDVLELQRLVHQQQQRIDALERQLAQPRTGVSANTSLNPGSAAGRTTEVPANWLNSADWERVRVGMPELEVIRILGVPNSLRKSSDGSRQTMYYALEIGTGGFLSGSVSVTDHKVVEVQKPTLK